MIIFFGVISRELGNQIRATALAEIFVKERHGVPVERKSRRARFNIGVAANFFNAVWKINHTPKIRGVQRNFIQPDRQIHKFQRTIKKRTSLNFSERRGKFYVLQILAVCKSIRANFGYALWN